MTDAPARLATTLADRYRIERELGRGGMATVYLAHDLRHDRKVAIKVLHPDLAAVLGGDRFLNEIKVTAHLQHPHILALFDSGAGDGILYYVMPHVEGESLRQRLVRERQLPVAEAVRLAREVAEALDYAHRRGVIHRDIKPENILLQEGRALVADFGIALAVRNAGGERITQTGLSLGTPQYMSPEQATAERELDARSDVYSLGCVLYEMLAGEPPHTGPTTQAVIAKIVADKVRPITQLRESVPPGVAAALHTALAKLAADRFGSAGEFASALADPNALRTAPWHAAETARPRSRLMIGAAALGLVAAVAGWLLRGKPPSREAPRPSVLSINASDLGGSGGGGANRQVALTSDGSAVIYLGNSVNTEGGLRLRRLDALDATSIPGSQLVYAPEPSPDGHWVAVRNLAGDPILLPLGGSGGRRLVGRGVSFMAWHPDGTLWLSRPPHAQLESTRPDGDSLEVRLKLDQGYWIQQILADGRTGLAIQAGIGTSSGYCVTIDLESGRVTPLVEAATVQARYAAGYLVYVRADGTLLAAPFDPERSQVTGPAVTLAENVGVTGGGEAQFAVAGNGTLAYIPEEARSLMLVDRKGAARLAIEGRQTFHAPAVSPDGRRLAVDVVSAEGRDVWILDLDQGTLERATFDRDGHDAVWTPDGRHITYATFQSGVLGIRRARPGSSEPAESLFASLGLNHSGYWLPDGSGLVAVATDLNPGSAQDIGIVRNGGRGPLEPLVATQFRENYPAISPDGRWLVFVSDQSGETRVYTRPISGDGSQVQVSLGAASEPVWSRDGREIFFRGIGEGGIVDLVAARVETTPALRVTARETLFPVNDYLPTTPHSSYDVSPDGKA